MQLAQRLEEFSLPTPNYAVVNREYAGQEVEYLVEEEDYVEIRGKRIQKPFVEKPVDGESPDPYVFIEPVSSICCQELCKHDHCLWSCFLNSSLVKVFVQALRVGFLDACG